MSLSVLSKINSDFPQIEIHSKKLHIPGNMPLADVQFYVPSEIGVLLAADHNY